VNLEQGLAWLGAARRGLTLPLFWLDLARRLAPGLAWPDTWLGRLGLVLGLALGFALGLALGAWLGAWRLALLGAWFGSA
jgi:hypothetical protein